jgi:DNA invertase Pin-like site-specific DNA recombinase
VHGLKIGYTRVSTDAQDLTAQCWYDNEVGEDIQLAQDFKTFVQALQSEDAFGAD